MKIKENNFRFKEYYNNDTELDQYYFDRTEFTNTVIDAFPDYCDTVEPDLPVTTDSFHAWRNEDEFFIAHANSGTIISYYKHLGRCNTCNREDFSLEDLKDFFEAFKEELQ